MNPLYLAIDTPDTDTARRIIDDVGDLIGGVKIGLTHWYANGPATVGATVEGFDWFFDGKIYDIPMQAAGAIRSLIHLKPTFISLHVGILKPNASEEESQREDSMLVAARSAAHDEADRLGVSTPKLLAVTILTHLPATPTQVVALGHRALLCGMDGLISSPVELPHLRHELGVGPILMTPGIRAIGTPPDDQHRTATAWEAMMRGANFIVVGRPITQETTQQMRRDKTKAILDSLP